MNTIETYDAAISLLQQEKILLAPSDTVLGLLGVCSKKAVENLNGIKQRVEKPYVVLIASLEEAERWVIIPESYKVLLSGFWPGPLTAVFKAQPTTPAFMASQSGTIAVRVPDQDMLQRILQKTGPLFSTSANLGGEAVPESSRDLSPELLKNVHGIFMIRDTVYPQVPSTIIDCTGDAIAIIRQGIVPVSQLK